MQLSTIIIFRFFESMDSWPSVLVHTSPFFLDTFWTACSRLPAAVREPQKWECSAHCLCFCIRYNPLSDKDFFKPAYEASFVLSHFVSLQASAGIPQGGTVSVKARSSRLAKELWLLLSLSRRLHVRLGEHNIAVLEGTEQFISAVKIIKHPSYKSVTTGHDIMLIKLAKPAILNKSVNTISLPSSCPKMGTQCLISGWGSTQLSAGEWASVSLNDRRVTTVRLQWRRGGRLWRHTVWV